MPSGPRRTDSPSVMRSVFTSLTGYRSASDTSLAVAVGCCRQYAQTDARRTAIRRSISLRLSRDFFAVLLLEGHGNSRNDRWIFRTRSGVSANSLAMAPVVHSCSWKALTCLCVGPSLSITAVPPVSPHGLEWIERCSVLAHKREKCLGS
jgi:hypothetical protein